MKKSPYTLFLIFWMLLSQIAFSQLTLKPGQTNLEDKTTEFGKIRCNIIPTVKYAIEKPNRLELRFKVKWYKKGVEISNPENYLFLFDNVNKYETYLDNKGISHEYLPSAISITKQSFNSIEVFNKQNKIPFKSFNSGFLKFNKNSGSPIVIENFNPKNALIKITLRFVYVLDEGNKLIFKDIASSELSWTFLLPDLEGYVDCNALAKDYGLKLDIISSQNDLAAAKKLKAEISKNPDFEKCNDVKLRINNYIDYYIDAEEKRIIDLAKAAEEEKIAKAERIAEAERLAKEKKENEKKEVQKPTVVKKDNQSKKKQWKQLASKYETELDNLDSKYNRLENRSNEIITELIQSVEHNSSNILELETIISSEDPEEVGSLESLKITYDLCNDINTKNKNTAEYHLRKLRLFKSELINKNQGCKNDYVKIDEKTGLDKSKKFRDRFSTLEGKIKNLEIKIENIQNNIVENENSILELLANFDMTTMLTIKELKSKYDSLFTIYYNEILEIDAKFISLRNEFENKRYGKWYFKSTRKKFLRKTDKLYSQLASLQSNDSLTKERKNEELAFYDFDSDFDNEKNFEKVIINLKPGIRYLRADIEEWPTRMFPILYLIMFVVVVAILIFGARVYYKAIKARKKKPKTAKPVIVSTESGEKSTSGGITITKTLSNHDIKGKGLSQVRAKTGVDFLELDLNHEWDDTTVKKIFFDRSCIIKTYRFFEDSVREVDTDTTANETGGYLIGRWDKNEEDPSKFDISLEDFIEPGDDATFSRYQLNFGAKIGIKLQKELENVRQKSNKDFIMTAWFHSHPGLKIFLSDYDLNVQKDFSRNDDNLKMIALVIDPYTEKWETGIFAYKSNGEMNNSQDSKQFFSLDEMYQWALSPVTENSDNFFSTMMQNNYPDSKVDKVSFPNPCILQIKRYLEDNKSNFAINDVMVYLEGDKIIKEAGKFDMVLKNLHITDEKITEENTAKNSILSCIIKTSGDYSSIAEALSNPEIIKNNISVVFVYNYNDSSLFAISKNKTGDFNNIPENIQKISLADMISWTRKRK